MTLVNIRKKMMNLSFDFCQNTFAVTEHTENQFFVVSEFFYDHFGPIRWDL
jgi:hypothetical protein